jgi:hypothetical protein
MGTGYGGVNRRTGSRFYIHYLVFTTPMATGNPYSFKTCSAAILAGIICNWRLAAASASVVGISERLLFGGTISDMILMFVNWVCLKQSPVGQLLLAGRLSGIPIT